MRDSRGRGGEFQKVRDQARELLAALEQGEVARVYLFSGTDDYQRQIIVRRVVAKLVPDAERDTRLTVFDGATVTGPQLAAELESSGFSFDDEPQRVVLVRDAPFFAAGRPPEDEVLKRRLEAGLLDDVVIVFDVRGNLDKRLGFTKLVQGLGVCLDFPALEGESEVQSFLQSRLRRAGKSMARNAVAELIARCGSEARQLTSEIDKLIAYVGDRSEIDLDDVKAMVAATAELSVFELVDAVAERRPREALQQLELMLDQQAAPMMILAMLIRQFRFLLQARHLLDKGIVDPRLLGGRAYDFNQQVTGKRDGRSLLDSWKAQVAEVLPTEGKTALLTQHYFPLWKTLTVARRMPAELIEATLERLLQTDLALKSSHLDPRYEMELLVIDLGTRMEQGATVEYDRLLDT